MSADTKVDGPHTSELYPESLKLIGHIDGVFDGYLCGWAMWQQPSTGLVGGGVTLTVIENERELGSITTELGRPDVGALVGGDGKCGFAFKLPPRLRDGSPHTIQLVTANGLTGLINNPITFVSEPPEHAPMFISCHKNFGTESSAFQDSPELLSLLTKNRFPDFVTDVCEVFPAYNYSRTAPNAICSADAGFLQDILRYNDTLSPANRFGFSARLILLKDVYLRGTRVHHIHEDRVETVYETARAADRPFTDQPEWTPSTLSDGAAVVSGDEPFLYLGSAGFVNYGHWLVDDLPRSAAVKTIAEYAGAKSVRVVSPSASSALNAAKTSSLASLHGDTVSSEMLFIPHDRTVLFKELFYVTPPTYHPWLKSPDACQYLRNAIAWHSNASQHRRLYITRRPERGRGIKNFDEVLTVLRRFGFTLVDVEGMSFIEQAQAFHAAEIVAGCMGAAMTNTVFSAPGTQVIYLAPVGWLEPFYWDLASVCGHSYTVLYGNVDEPGGQVHLSNFRVDVSALSSTLERAVSAS